jgi:hypothetical protein
LHVQLDMADRTVLSDNNNNIELPPTVVAALLKGEGQATGTCELRAAKKGPACAVLCCLHLPPPHKYWASAPADSLDGVAAADHDIPFFCDLLVV